MTVWMHQNKFISNAKDVARNAINIIHTMINFFINNQAQLLN